MALLDRLKPFESVSKHLQTGGTERPNLHHVRIMFSGLLETNPDEAHVMTQLKTDSDVVHCPDFENGIVKIEAGDELQLTTQEKNAVKRYLVEERGPSRASGRSQQFCC